MKIQKHIKAKKEISPRIWMCIFLCSVLLILLLTALAVVWLDPFFHYHPPLADYYYNIDSERYQNDGIMRHFDYDAVITGTSMTENFKTSEADGLFDARFIKVPYSGGSFYDVSEGLERALKTHRVRYVIRSLDYNFLASEWDRSEGNRNAFYLYDDHYYNDVEYLFNKDVLIKYCLPMLEKRSKGEAGGCTSFDEFANFSDGFADAKRPVFKTDLSAGKKVPYNEKDRKKLKENLEKNIIRQAVENPNTEFDLFFPPYSVAYWQSKYEDGTYDKYMEEEKETIELLLDIPNIKLFSFNEERDITTNCELYSDDLHYSEDINTKILDWISRDIHRLTKDNYEDYLEWERGHLFKYDR